MVSPPSSMPSWVPSTASDIAAGGAIGAVAAAVAAVAAIAGSSLDMASLRWRLDISEGEEGSTVAWRGYRRAAVYLPVVYILSLSLKIIIIIKR